MTVLFGLSAGTAGGALADGNPEGGTAPSYRANARSSEAVETLDVTARFDTVQGVLLDACQQRGYGEECAKTLLGMLWKESRNVATAVGDGGKARGYFQIHYRLHGISVECAEDLRCSAEWTLDYLEYNGYPRYVTYAVQCHNGCGARNGYAASALRHGRNLWDVPMFPDEGEMALAAR